VELTWAYRQALSIFPTHLTRVAEHKWIRITLESDEDRSKLFSHLYQQTVRECGLDKPKVSLSECRRKCKTLKIQETRYLEFIHQALHIHPTRIPSPKRSSDDTKLSMSEYGSLQAVAFRDIQSEKMAFAQNKKSILQAHFGKHLSETPLKSSRSRLPCIQTMMAKENIDIVISEPMNPNSDTIVTPPGTPKSDINETKEFEDLRGRELSMKRRLTASEQARATLQRESVLNKEMIAQLQDENRKYKSSYDALELQCLEIEREYTGKIEALQNLLHNLKSTSRSSGEFNDDISPVAALKRLNKTQLELEHADAGRVRAETRAKEATTRCVELTQQMSEMVLKQQDVQDRNRKLERDLTHANVTTEKLYETRDQLLDQIRETRGGLIVSLEAERVERSVLNRKMKNIQVVESKKNPSLESRLLHDAECSLSRTKKELVNSEQESKSLQQELADIRIRFKEQSQHYAEKNIHDTITNELETAKQERLKAVKEKDYIQQVLLESEKLKKQATFQITRLKHSLETMESERQAAGEDVERMKVEFSKSLSNKQHDMEVYKTKLKQTLGKEKDLIRQECNERIESVRIAHRTELTKLVAQNREDTELALSNQRENFSMEMNKMNDDFSQRLEEYQSHTQQEQGKVQEEHQREIRNSIDKVLQEEQKRSNDMLSEMYEERELLVVQMRQRNAIMYLNQVLQSASCARLYSGWSRWKTKVQEQRAEEMVEVYGIAMDQANAAAKLACVGIRFRVKNLTLAFSHWKQPKQVIKKIESKNKFFIQPIFPGELIRKMRRQIPQKEFMTFVYDFVNTLNCGIDGKITTDSFYEGLGLLAESRLDYVNQNRTESIRDKQLAFDQRITAVFLNPPQEKLSPSRNNLTLATMFPFWCRRRDLKLKFLAWSKWFVFNRLLPVENEFLQNMETKALQEEVRSLHVQLGESKSEAWNYKRKLLTCYQQDV